MAFRRHLSAVLLERAAQWPVVTVTGPRHAGKTTLCRQAFPGLPCANLEQPDVREFALQDPRGFLRQFPRGAVLDEIQRCPELLSWVQVAVDEPSRSRDTPFILTTRASMRMRWTRPPRCPTTSPPLWNAICASSSSCATWTPSAVSCAWLQAAWARC